MSWLIVNIEYLGMALISPREYMKIIIVERRSIITGFVIVIVMSILFGLIATSVFVARALSIIGLNLLGVWSSIGGLGIVVSIMVALWLVLSALIYAYSRLFKGEASFEQVLNASALKTLPMFIHGLLSPLYYLLDPITSMLLFISIHSIVFIWGLIISAIALAEANRYGIGRSLASIILAYATLILIILLPSILLATTMSWMV